MKSVFLVRTDEFDTSRRMEKILLALPEESGILFVSASVIDNLSAGSSRNTIYKLVVGCDRSKDVKLIELVVKTYLKEEVVDVSQLMVEVYRGVDRKYLSA